MTLTLVAPTPEAAAALAARLFPGRRLIGEPVAISSAQPADARQFCEQIKATKTHLRQPPCFDPFQS